MFGRLSARKTRKKLIDRARATRARGYTYQRECDEALLLRGNIEEARYHRDLAMQAWDAADAMMERAMQVNVRMPKTRERATRAYRIYRDYARECVDESIDDRNSAQLASLMLRLDEIEIADIDPKDRKARDQAREWLMTMKNDEDFEISAKAFHPLMKKLAEELASQTKRYAKLLEEDE